MSSIWKLSLNTAILKYVTSKYANSLQEAILPCSTMQLKLNFAPLLFNIDIEELNILHKQYA